MRRPSAAELVARLRRDGARGVLQRAVYEAYRRSGASALESTIDPADIADPAAAALLPRAEPVVGDPPPRVAWVCSPPSAGSGGHTTLFRMVAGIAGRGADCTVLLYDTRHSDVARHAATIRSHWPWLHAGVGSVDDGFAGYDAVVASSWETAHVVATRATAPTARLYFVQDYEPYFYPHGTLHAFAQDSYRLGLRTIALGGMVERELAALGVRSDVAPWGRDLDTYHDRGGHDRAGVCFYARRDNDRRGYLLGMLALREFHRRRPSVPIHVYGDEVSGWDIPVVSHGTLTPDGLDALYNRVVAGLVLSFTNVSLVPDELLASGAVPVVNENGFAREVLDEPDVVWAPSSFAALASALVEVIDRRDDPRPRPRRAARSWDAAQDVVWNVLGDELSTGDSTA